MSEPKTNQKAEAVCFTAGAQGAAFGAGVIHAWLAADRDAPRVAAGISMGSITAAAMQRSMAERGPKDKRTEGSRWGWFQGYLRDIADHPLDVIWKALPDPVDYFASTMPVSDLSCPPHLKSAEREARFHFSQLVKVGNWFAAVPVTVGQIARLGILKVRHDEGIPVPTLGSGCAARAWRCLSFRLQAVAIGLQVLLTILVKPCFTRTKAQFLHDEGRPAGRGISLGFRPLFGWKLWLSAAGLALVLAILSGAAIHFLRPHPLIVLALMLVLLMLPESIWKRKLTKQLQDLANRMDESSGSLMADQKTSMKEALFNLACQAVGVDLGLVNSYALKRRLWERFRNQHSEANPPVRCDCHEGTNLVVVASVLQSFRKRCIDQQVWARDGYPLVDAIAAACAIPRLFPPVHLSGTEAEQWIRPKDLADFERDAEGHVIQEFDLIDGGELRKNPLPALFNWLHEHTSVAESLTTNSREDARIHVIYNVPIEPFDANNGKPAPARIDLIESAQVGLLMRARRDTKMEVLQTNFLSDIENATKGVRGQSHQRFPVYADEIAPAREIQFINPLEPTAKESLASTAEGCRRTLTRLYQNEIAGMRPLWRDFVLCEDLIRRVAPDRAKEPCLPGLSEVCAQCDRKLRPYPQPPDTPKLVKQSVNQKTAPEEVVKQLPNLCAVRPRIAFVASGGVFRGAFHIGLLGAMQTMGMTPDLVVGASVGTLMGAALAAMRNLHDEDEELGLLALLSDTFLEVDSRIALTVSLKTAVKQVGLRARRLKLSPRRMRSLVRAGTVKDAGYAATGVPPLVIDTLAGLFLIPPAETHRVGTSFLAGKFAEAFFRLASLLRSRTLDRLQVRYAVIGDSLIERTARALLSPKEKFNLNTPQPYLADGTGTAIFCTTALVNQRWPLLLGRDTVNASPDSCFSFLHSALGSSAFPAAFEPRSEAEVFPGAGRADHLLCDGGTFDNLPFVPTIELLSVTQSAAASSITPHELLTAKLAAPDLIISAGFDPQPEFDQRPKFESARAVAARACALASSVKTDSFVEVNKKLEAALKKLATVCKNGIDKKTASFAKECVVAGIINVVPTSNVHVNPTFAFARSIGLDRERVALSIGDGCFQTLLSLEKEWSQNTREGRSLKEIGVKEVTLRRDLDSGGEGCPYFEIPCAFQQAARTRHANGCETIYQGCSKDPTHRKLIQIALKHEPRPKVKLDTQITAEFEGAKTAPSKRKPVRF